MEIHATYMYAGCLWQSMSFCGLAEDNSYKVNLRYGNTYPNMLMTFIPFGVLYGTNTI